MKYTGIANNALDDTTGNVTCRLSEDFTCGQFRPTFKLSRYNSGDFECVTQFMT